jgi:hypothetical protein
MTDSISLSDFETLIAEAYDLDAELKDLKRDVIEPRRKRLKELEAKILQTLADHDMTSYKSGRGTVVRQTRYSVCTPKTLEEKTAFFEWLNRTKGRDVYWSYVTINSQSLNAFYNAEMEAAKEAGAFDYVIPGLAPPEATPVLSRRKK